ncbi:MAG: hypothetical protein WCS37_19725, partial [Chloroflexota bacterium]
EFMAFFFPKIHQDIDWSRNPEFLDKELEQLFNEGNAGRRLVDKLVKVYRLGTEEPIWLLIHLEIQGYADPSFAQRMFIYNYRLYDRYFQPKGIDPGSAGRLDKVISLAVLTDGNKRYHPKRFHIKEWGFELSFKFPSVKLLKYNENWAALEANPQSLCDSDDGGTEDAPRQTQATRGAFEYQVRTNSSLVRASL